MKGKDVIPIILAALLILSISSVFLRQQASAEEASGYSVESWVFGDVVELNLENNQFILTYFDYDNKEKEIAIKVDAQTKYENVNGLEDIKVGDALGVDYLVTPEGEAIALNISVEGIKDAEQSSF
jgi:hypothetical protein